MHIAFLAKSTNLQQFSCVWGTVDALVSNGLASAGYTYVNLGTYGLSLSLGTYIHACQPESLPNVYCEFFVLPADDCWADYQRTKEVLVYVHDIPLGFCQIILLN